MPLILMVGRETSGYCATGSPNKEIVPVSTRNSEMTIAKIGLSMKNLATWRPLDS